MTVEEAVLQVLNMFVKHKLPKRSLESQLKLINSMLPIGHNMPKSLLSFKKFVENQVPSCKTIKHFFCKSCFIFFHKLVDTCSNCGSENVSHFFEIDVIEQITQLLETTNISKKIMDIKINEDLITDVIDGSEYRRINATRNKYDLTLMMYTDGISLLKSTSSHCWLLMFVIAELPPHIRYKNIITVGVWHDKDIKPPINLFLRPFCQKLCENQYIKWKDPETGEENISKISAPLFIADASARAEIQNLLCFNGQYGCNICELKTVACENESGKKLVRVYPYKKHLKLRDGTEMAKQAEIVENTENLKHFKGVKGTTIISCLPNIDISTCVVPEYMHSVLLGVTKQFLNVWLNKKGNWRIFKNIKKIDKFLLNIRPIKAYKRKPYSIKKFHLFKASELFNWLIYYSLPTVNNNIPDVYLQHWMLLVIGIFNLVQKRLKVSTHVKK